MAQDQGKTRFIRKNGKVIPIKSKKGGSGGSGNAKNKMQEAAVRKSYSKGFKKIAKKEREYAKTGRTVSKAAFGVSALAGLTAVATKGKRGVFTAIGSGLFGVTTAGHATGKETSAKILERGSKQILGQKVRGGGPVAIGASAQRAEFMVNYGESKSRRVGQVGFHKAFNKKKKNKNNTGF